jgi:hypothetical protein
MSARARTIPGMWQVRIVCSDCADEVEVVVADLDDVEREVCGCGYSFVVLAVAELELVELDHAADPVLSLH